MTDQQGDKMPWWGYRHIDGNLQVKRYFGPKDLEEARESDFVDQYHGPFMASDRQEALSILEKKVTVRS